MGTKNNPGQFDCYKAAESDEPMFILLARDPLAPILVDLWASLRYEAGCITPDAICSKHKAKVNEARKVADEMRAFRRIKNAQARTNDLSDDSRDNGSDSIQMGDQT